MKDTTIAVDLASTIFEVAVSERPGRVSDHQRLSRARFTRFFAQHEAATVVLEACGSAHHWGRQLQGFGHRVVLLPPHAVRPYVTRNKTDRTDAKGLLEAFRNEDIRPVPVKTVSQHVLATLHRLRSGWLARRTACLNTVRGVLRELGILIPAGAQRVCPAVAALLEDADSALPDALRPALAEMLAEIRGLERRMQLAEAQLHALADETPVVSRLVGIPGLGVLTATALVANVGDVQRFPSARHFASYLGLTPRERSSGLQRRLGAISKRGDAYLRMLFTHGARAVLGGTKRRAQVQDRLRAWALEVESRRGHNKATIALANKLARIAWAVWKRDVPFQEIPVSAA